MSLLWFLQLLSLYVVLSANICDGAVPPCRADWFGSACRYQCHCATGGTCNKTTGECTEPTTCEKGWFGPSCQYVDLLTTNTSSTSHWVYDSPDIPGNPGQDAVTITLTNEFYFTWLRLRTNVTVNSHAFTLQLMPLAGSAVDCAGMSTFMVNETTMDIHCQTGAFFKQLTLSGEGVKYLCSVQISGGRNVALGQNTTQTADFLNRISSLAVDGDINPDWEHGSCTDTGTQFSTTSWTLTFDRPHYVTRYVLYNRNTLQERLRGFNLNSYQENKDVAFTYIDTSSANSDIYRIQSKAPQIPVSNVTIVATHLENINYLSYYVLTLCEVEMFGDSVCATGQWGRECENKCHCAKNGESCFVSTGGCPSGCAAGYLGESCQTPCNKTYYGHNCSEKCSIGCKDQECQPSNGTCLSCVPGKKMPTCTDDCDDKWWGDNCAMPCSSNCTNQLCNTVNGKCNSCDAGKFGDNCDNACNATSYGEGCALACSLNCFDRHCNATNGNCLSCVTGKSGLFCSEACPQTTFGNSCRENCSINCTSQLCDPVSGKCASCVQRSPGDYCDQTVPVNEEDESPPVGAIVGPVVALVVLIALIVGGVFIWRKNKHIKNNHGQTSSLKHTNFEQTECMRGGKSNGLKSQSLNSVTGQATPSVLEKSIVNEDSTEISHIGRGYYNFVPRLSEILDIATDHESSTIENGVKYQQPIKNVLANNNTVRGAAGSLDHTTNDTHTSNSDYIPYETPMASTAVIQKSQQLKSEEGLAYENGFTDNPYESIDDTTPSPYEEITDIQST